MSKSKLLILDANVVIHLHEFGIWAQFIAVCDVHLPGTVVSEAEFYEAGGQRQYIDLSEDIQQRRIQVFDVELAKIKAFRDRFDLRYAEGLDDGESEALAYLCETQQAFLISSGDAIVYRVLGRLNRSDRGISLEEILKDVGLQRSQLPWSCSRQFREKYTREGSLDVIQGAGMKNPKK